jgi:hypothetical protein
VTDEAKPTEDTSDAKAEEPETPAVTPEPKPEGASNEPNDRPRSKEAAATEGDASSDASPSGPGDSADTGDVVFDTLWSRVVAAWDDDKPHGALVEYALRAQKLPELAGKYKAMTQDPEKKERAQKRLDGVVMAATQLLFAMKSPPLPKSNKPLNIVAALGTLAAIIYLVYIVVRSRSGVVP